MTGKRFTHKEDDWEILDRNKHFAFAHSGYQAEKIIQELNELVETNRELYKENKQLKQFKEQHIEEYLKLKSVCNDCKRENEQLKDALNQRTEQCDKYYEENEQLKQKNKKLADALTVYFQSKIKGDLE